MDTDVPCIYTVEYHAEIEKNETLPFVTTWTNPEGIVLSEISQVEKDIWYGFIICGI